MPQGGLAAGAALLCFSALLLFIGRLDVPSGAGMALASADRLPPGARLLADALKDVSQGSPSGTSQLKKSDGARPGGPRTAAAGSMPRLEQAALRMQGKMSPLSSMPRRRAAIDERSLPAAGTHEWKVAKAKEEVRSASLRLAIDKEQRRLDKERAAFDKLYKGPVGQKLLAREALAARVKDELSVARKMQAKARKLSDRVVTDLHVKKGHFDIKKWYRSQSAFKSSQESTSAVKKAKDLWAKAMTDQQALRKVGHVSPFAMHTLRFLVFPC